MRPEAPQHAPLPLVLFARLPVPGRAKTRLAAGVGAEEAAAFYTACAEHVVAQALRWPGQERRGAGSRIRRCGGRRAGARREQAMGAHTPTLHAHQPRPQTPHPTT